MKKHFSTDEERLTFYLSIQVGETEDPDETNRIIYNKVCDVKYGDRVTIVWLVCGEEIEDHGYVMGWPSHLDHDANMAGVVHVPDPSNPGGKGDVEQEWVTLYELRTNPQVVRVEKRL